MIKGGEDRPVIVTGAASGIGQATATELRRQGARIIGVDLRDADIIAVLASPQNGNMVGQVVFADGGSDVLLRGEAVL